MMMSPLRVWWLAVRPKTLWASVSPVLMGTAMALDSGGFHAGASLVALACALLIQVGTNLANDYFDFRKGADTAERLGPIRVTQAGLLSPAAVFRAMIAAFLLAAMLCLYLVQRGGWPIIVIGVLAMACGILYTAGPWPLGYVGLGELFVLIFFGPVAVGATFYVQAHSLHDQVLFAGLAPGLLSVALLTVNNLRDIEQDRKAGKRTLAVRFGKTFAQWEYVFCVLSAWLIPTLLCARTREHGWILATWALAPAAVPALRAVFNVEGTGLNAVLARTARLALLFSVLFSVGWIL